MFMPGAAGAIDYAPFANLASAISIDLYSAISFDQ